VARASRRKSAKKELAFEPLSPLSVLQSIANHGYRMPADAKYDQDHGTEKNEPHGNNLHLLM
jgi:hypothetical protein